MYGRFLNAHHLESKSSTASPFSFHGRQSASFGTFCFLLLKLPLVPPGPPYSNGHVSHDSKDTKTLLLVDFPSLVPYDLHDPLFLQRPSAH